MSLISKAISNLFNGVSQQAPALRLPSQADAQLNMVSSPVEGLHKRPPLSHLARIADTFVAPKVHTIVRDKTERYQVIIDEGDLKVFDLVTGQERTVSFPDGKGYLTSANARTNLKTLTVEDYTFILNRNVAPTMAVSPYLSTDVIGVSINFGSGVLGEPYTFPKPPATTFYWQFKSGFTSSGSPKGWLRQGPYPTYDAAMNAWEAFVRDPSYGGTIGGYLRKPIIQKLIDNPMYRNDADVHNDTFGIGVQITNDTDSGANRLLITNTAVSPSPFDPELSIFYTHNLSTSDTTNSLSALRGDVGWPNKTYHVPTWTYQDKVINAIDGAIVVEVNGTQFTHVADPTWSAEDYANAFAADIAGSFPGVTVSIVDGWQLQLEGTAGEQLYVRAWDTNGHGYVQTSYKNLPIQESLFIVIKAGIPSMTYSVSINGHDVHYKATDTTSVDGYTSETIAQNLTTQINALPGFAAALYGSFIKVINTDNVPITFAWKDTYGNQGMYAMKNRIRYSSDLPPVFVPGHPIEVAEESGTTGYYVHYVVDGAKPTQAYGLERQVTQPRANLVVTPAGNTWNAIEGKDTGVWEECGKPGIPDVLIPSSMPHVLISNADGTFTFKQVDWFKRVAGDDDSVPAPSFVGKKMVDLLFTRDRLAFMCGTSIVFSRTGRFFNFWAETAKDVLATDPIDVTVNHHKVATLRTSAVFNGQTLLFSDSTQFVVSAKDVLTPSTVNIQPASEYVASASCVPLSLGSNVYFASEAGGYSNVWEYYLETQANQSRANSVTAPVPKYVPSGAYKLCGSTELSVLACLTDGKPASLFVYKFINGQQEKLQESWSEWTFGGTILNADFIETSLYVTVARADGVFLEKMDLRDGLADGNLPFLVCLDRKAQATGTANSLSTVSVIVPYDESGEVLFVDPTDGARLTATKTATSTYTVATPRVGTTVFCGTPYQSLYRFSPQFFKDNEKQSMLDGRLQYKNWAVTYAKSCKFDVTVTPQGRTPRVYSYESPVTGVAVLGQITPQDGIFRFPVMGSSKDCTITVTSDSHLPVFLLGAVYEADFYIRTQRM